VLEHHYHSVRLLQGSHHHSYDPPPRHCHLTQHQLGQVLPPLLYLLVVTCYFHYWLSFQNQTSAPLLPSAAGGGVAVAVERRDMFAVCVAAPAGFVVPHQRVQ